jgi:hypothetical protein
LYTRVYRRVEVQWSEQTISATLDLYSRSSLYYTMCVAADNT